MTIGETIKALRTQKGMTQAELARAIGVSKYTIMKRGHHSQTLESFNV